MNRISILLLVLIANALFAQNKKITVEDIWATQKFSAKTVSGFTSMNDGLTYTVLEQDKEGSKINKYDYKEGKLLETIINTATTKPGADAFFIEDYQFSSDEKRILISANSEAIYRHSFKAANFIYDMTTKKLEGLNNGQKQQLAELSPDGNLVAYMQDNNLFVKEIATSKLTQITKDGKHNEIINGAPDWVYEEEFGFSKGWFWNADGSKIAFYKFDESRVKEYMLQYSGELYPKEYRYKYPKAGEENSIVNVFVYDLKSNNSVKVDVGTETNQYIPRIQWTNNPNELFVTRMNRLQNKLEVLKTDANTGKNQVILTETSDTYVDLHESIQDLFYFTADNNSFMMMLERDGFNHLYSFDMSGKLKQQITKGPWEITDFYGIDSKTKTAYFQSAEEGAIYRTVYAISFDGKTKKKLSPLKGSNSTIFSKGYKYYINYFTNANTPQLVTLHSADTKQIRVLEDNAAMKKTMGEYELSKKEFFTLKTSEGVELNGWMIKPNAFDATKKYPVFMTFYGGPGKNMVTDEFGGRDLMWHLMLAQKGYMVVCVDNRGTQARGAAFKKSTYKQLGKLEVADQIETAKYLGTLPYVDAARIGCEGWSYGGYLTSLCMTKGADLFKMGIAVAPVTNWRFYDSIYTERFLQTPQENPTGYDENSPINFVKAIKGKYLLIHGTGDDNVHFQNSIEMVNSLVKANKQFDSFYYPDRTHSIAGGYTRLHLFTMMTNYIVANL